MGLFSRRNNKTPETSQPADHAYPNVTAADADWIRATGVQILAGLGQQARVSADGTMLETASGTSFGLDNAMAKCLAAPRETWPQVLDKHFGSVVRGFAGPSIDDLTRAQLETQVRTRLMPVDGLRRGEIDLTYARPVTEDLALVLCIDFPETVSYVDSPRAREMDLEATYARGQQNTDAEPIDQVFTIDGTAVTVLQGESVFIASKVGNMERLVQQVYGRPAPHGVFVAVPDRNTALLHLIESAEAIHAVGQLAGVAIEQFSRGVGALSQNTYHWQDGRFSTAAGLNATNGSIEIRPTEELTQILVQFTAT